MDVPQLWVASSLATQASIVSLQSSPWYVMDS